jgi:hypothetical protein
MEVLLSWKTATQREQCSTPSITANTKKQADDSLQYTLLEAGKRSSIQSSRYGGQTVTVTDSFLKN